MDAGASKIGFSEVTPRGPFQICGSDVGAAVERQSVVAWFRVR